jgi:hypothetical protein
MDTCYMCEAPATSREHIPPRCIFPKGEAFRKDLMTVPSCDAHNGQKSTSDQYLRHVLIAALGNNPLALQVADEAAIPRLEKQPHLMKTFLPDLREVTYEGIRTGAFRVDVERFNSVIGALVRGLYFKEIGKKLVSSLDFMWSALHYPSSLESPFAAITRQSEERHPADYKGANPEVFAYAFNLVEEGEETKGLCRLRFYDGPPIYVLLGAPPLDAGNPPPGEKG